MTLDELKKIDCGATTASYRVSELKNAQRSLQSLRTGPHDAIDAVFNVLSQWSYGSDKIAKSEFMAVLTEQMGSAMRIAELRIEAQSRAEGVKESLLRQQLAAFFGEDRPVVVEVSA